MPSPAASPAPHSAVRNCQAGPAAAARDVAAPASRHTTEIDLIYGGEANTVFQKIYPYFRMRELWENCISGCFHVIPCSSGGLRAE